MLRGRKGVNMKIYFEDGEILNPAELPICPNYIVDAAAGVSDNIKSLDSIYNDDCNNIVYTNSIFAFDNRYAWNRKLGLPEIYIRKSRQGEFVNIASLTERELREGHNLARLYIGGEFSEDRSAIDM